MRKLTLLRIVIGWLPAILIGFWGFAYFRAMALTALGPGAPVTIIVPTPGGELSIKTSSYSLSFKRGIATAFNVQIYDPLHRLIAASKKVEVRFPPVSATHGPYRIIVRDAYLVLRREKSGRFEFQSFLPKSTGKPSAISLSVHGTKIRGVYIDKTSNQTFRQRFTSNNVYFYKTGPEWTANGRATLANAGEASLRLSGMGAGVQGSVSVNPLIVRPAFVSLESFLPLNIQTQLQQFGFQMVQVKGTASFRSSTQAPFQIKSQLSFTGKGLRYRNYHVAMASGEGFLDTHHFTGNVQLNSNNLSLKAIGMANWSHGFEAKGSYNGSGNSINEALAIVHKTVPKGIAVRHLSSTGIFNYSSQNGLQMGGQIDADTARYSQLIGNQNKPIQLVSRGIKGTYALSKTAVVFEGTSETDQVGKTSVSGLYQLQSKVLKLHLNIPSLLLAEAQKFASFDPKNMGSLHGTVAVNMNLQGDLSDPAIDFRIQGSGTYREPETALRPIAPVALSGIAALGSFQNRRLILNRLWLKTSAGTVWGSAHLNFANQKLYGRMESRGIDLSQLAKNTTGLTVLKATIQGAFSDPVMLGNLEVYNPKYNAIQVTLIKTQIEASPHRIDLTHLIALRGSSFVTGKLALALPSQKISGYMQSQGISLYDLFGSNFGGTIAVSANHIAGTLSKPQVQFSGIGGKLIVDKMPVNAAYFSGGLDQTEVNLQSLSASLAEGYIKLNGKYSLKSKTGNAVAHIIGVNLDHVVPIYAPESELDLDGIATGIATGSFNNQGLIYADSTGNIKNIIFNGATEGQGVWSFIDKENQYTGSLQVANEDKFLALENGKYSPETGNYSANLLMNQIPVANLYVATSPFINRLGPVDRTRLQSLRGQIQVGATVQGNIHSPEAFSLTVPQASFQQIVYEGVPLGAVQLSGTYSDQKANLQNLFYQDGATVGNAVGTYDPSGNTNIELNLSNIDLKKLSTLIPQSPKVSGSATLAAVISGKSANPDLRASLDVENAKTGIIPSVFALSLDDIEAKNGNFTVGGNVTYDGFVGLINGKTSYDPGHGISNNNPINLNITFAKRPLKDLAEYSRLIDPVNAKGYFQGQANLTGTIAHPNLSASGNMVAQSLRFEQPLVVSGSQKSIPFSTFLKNADLEVNLKNDILSSKFSADSSASGSVNVAIQAHLLDLQKGLESPGTMKLNSLLRSPLQGNLQFHALSVNEKTNLVVAKASLSGAVTFGGSIKRPQIDGNLSVDNLDTTLPTLASGSSSPSKPVIDPQFNLKATIGKVGVIRTALASIKLRGAAQLTGALSSPNVAANLQVAGGSLRLPGGNVRLIPGGTVDGSYSVDATGTSSSHLDVNLVAETRVVAAQLTGTLQRYDVTLNITGNLLNPDQVQFSASSDPPDLSQTQILALLGRTDILTALGSGSSFNQTQQALTGVIAGYAVPSLLNPVTRNLAAGLGLDYLNVEYNQYSQASLVIGKNFGDGFSFFGSRQISEPQPGLPRFYDYKIQYRPKFFSGALRRLSFILGQDQYTPWKIGIQYSVRF